MRKFKDSQGREWSLSLNIAQAKRLKEHGIDLLDGGQSLQALATDPYTIANALYLLCESQCKAANVTDEQFGEALAGDTIDAATEALTEEIVDFFPKRQRQAVATMLAKTNEILNQKAALATTKLASPEMDRAIAEEMRKTEAEIDRMLGDLSGKQPAASESSPAA